MSVTPWTKIESQDKSAGAAGSASLAMALRDNAVHDREILYDPERHAPTAAHRHRGDDSEHVGHLAPVVANLISRPYAQKGGPWHLNGVTATSAGFMFAAGGQWASIPLGDFTRPENTLNVFGRGAPLVVSGYLEATGTLTAGTIQMGLINGGDTGQDLKAFIAGSRFDVPAEVISTGWRRFWAVIDTAGMSFDTSIRFCVQCSSALMPVGASVTANLFDVRPGRVLDYPVPGYVTDYGDDWVGWGNAGSGGPPPPYDHSISIADAIRLGAR